MNGGIYLIKKNILNKKFKNDSSIENDVLKKLITKKKGNWKIFKQIFYRYWNI